MDVEVEVTAEDLKLGHKAFSEACPIQQALCRMKHPETLVHFSVSPKVIRVYELGKEEVQISLPKEAQGFIKLYDKEKEVFPFKFKIKVPEDSKYFKE